jgi:hypothetical protein
MKQLKNLATPAKIVMMFFLGLIMTLCILMPIAIAISSIFPDVTFNDVVTFPIFVIIMFITYIMAVITSASYLEVD